MGSLVRSTTATTFEFEGFRAISEASDTAIYGDLRGLRHRHLTLVEDLRSHRSRREHEEVDEAQGCYGCACRFCARRRDYGELLAHGRLGFACTGRDSEVRRLRQFGHVLDQRCAASTPMRREEGEGLGCAPTPHPQEARRRRGL